MRLFTITLKNIQNPLDRPKPEFWHPDIEAKSCEASFVKHLLRYILALVEERDLINYSLSGSKKNTIESVIAQCEKLTSLSSMKKCCRVVHEWIQSDKRDHWLPDMAKKVCFDTIEEMKIILESQTNITSKTESKGPKKTPCRKKKNNKKKQANTPSTSISMNKCGDKEVFGKEDSYEKLISIADEEIGEGRKSNGINFFFGDVTPIDVSGIENENYYDPFDFVGYSFDNMNLVDGGGNMNLSNVTMENERLSQAEERNQAVPLQLSGDSTYSYHSNYHML